MKYINNLSILIIFLISCTTSIKKNDGQINFAIPAHDFGKVKMNAPAKISFVFTNHGKSPVIIQKVESTCGCTVPEWPRKPLKPGNKGEIIVTYDTSRSGVFSKTIFVSYNGKQSPAKLTIRGEVVE